MQAYWKVSLQSDGGWGRTLTFTQDGVAYPPLAGVDSVVMTITPETEAPVVLSVGNGITVNGPAGTISFALTRPEIAAFKWNTATHETLITFTDEGDEAIQLNGPVTII